MLKNRNYLQEFPNLSWGVHYHFKDDKRVKKFTVSGKRSDPVTMMVIAATALETVSVLREGQQQANAENYNAKVSEAQSRAVGVSADYEGGILKQQSAVEQAKIQRAKTQTTATQRATYAKSGVRIDEGSPIEVMADTASQYELDLSANRYNLATGLEKIRYESQTQQAQLTADAAYRRQLAKAYKTASYLKAGTSILTGGYLASKELGGGFKPEDGSPKSLDTSRWE